MNISYFGINSVAALWKKIIERIPTKLSDLENDSGFVTSDDSVHHADFATADRKGHVIHEYYASKFSPTLFGITTAPFIVTNSVLGGVREEPFYQRRMDVSTVDHPYWEWYDPDGGYYFYKGGPTGKIEERTLMGAITPEGIYEGNTRLEDKYLQKKDFDIDLNLDFMTEQDVSDLLEYVLGGSSIQQTMTEQDVYDLMQSADIMH